MRFHLLSLVLSVLPITLLAFPSTPKISDLFRSSEIPTLSASEAAILLNLTSLPPPALSKRAINLQYLAYRITLNGNNVGNWVNFQRTGVLLVTQGIPSLGTRNGKNPYEIVLYAGDNPAFIPVAGSIRYVSNRYLYGLIGGTAANSVLDFAYMTVTGNRIDLRVDQSAFNQRSMFNALTGPTAQVYQIKSGTMAFNLGTKSVTGGVALVGSGFTSGSVGHPYRAIVSGVPLGKFTMVI